MSSIKEVAHKAGVSEATVSRVLNQDKNFAVSIATRNKIIQAAEALKYMPKKKPVEDRKGVKIYLVHQPSGKELAGDTFYVQIKSDLEIEGNKRGYEMININRPELIKKRDMLLAEGLIAIGKFNKKEMDKLKSLASSQVFIDSRLSHYDTVNLEAEKAVTAILDHLISLKHDRIAFIGARNEADPDVPEIRSQYVYKYLEAKKKLTPAYIKIGNFDVDTGYLLTRELLELSVRPTALFLIDDKLAIGAYRAILEAGLHIPHDISVIGYSDISVSRYLIPALTTYRVEFEKITKEAFSLLEEQWEGRIVSRKAFVAGSIIQRESTGPAHD